MDRVDPVLDEKINDAYKVPSEHVEQRQFVSWFRKVYSPIRILAIPNGGGRSKTEGMRLKAEGVSAGVPDLFIPEWSLWVEMKRQKGGAVSKDQKDWHRYLRSIGQNVAICKGFEAAKQYILKFEEGLY